MNESLSAGSSGSCVKRRRDRIVIISTHIVEDLTHLSPTLAVMNEGQILFAGAPQELQEHAGKAATLEDGYLALLQER